MKVKTNYEHGEDITAGKEYEVLKWYPKGTRSKSDAADIRDDEGYKIYIIVSNHVCCVHLDNEGHWEIVEEDA